MTTYHGYSAEELEELASNFLIESWSYSKVTSFARNEKAFEMSYIYGIYSRKSASSVAGNAYHASLQQYFLAKKEGKTLDIVDLERIAFDYINDVPGNTWKLQKTTATIEECQKKAIQIVGKLLRFFVKEIHTYESEISEIIEVETYFDEYLTINGVDIPLPCHGVIDLVVRTTSGKIAVIDHKSKSAYSGEDEVALTTGIQAITYVKAYEARTNIRVDEVWFVENKYSENKDKSAQLYLYKINVDSNTRKLYEALLYEPLKRMIEAVSNPDYVYLINDADNYVDKAELYDFWARTLICEVEDFNVPEAKKDLVSKRLKKIRDSSIDIVSPKVIKQFRENASQFIQYDLSSKDMTEEQKIEHVLRSFGTIVSVAHKFSGYSSNTYLLQVSAGVKITNIASHRLDIANALDVENVRISKQLTVYQGRSYVAIDFAKKRDKDLPFDPSELKGRKIPLGKDNFQQTIYWDLDNNSTPHMLVCGGTGSGKTVFLKSIIEYASLIPVDEIVIFDPKYDLNEFDDYNNVRVFNEIEDIEEQMANLVVEMNQMIRERKRKYTLVIFDEIADAFANARSGKELAVYDEVFAGNFADGSVKTKRQHVGELKSLEDNHRILLQKGRSSGFRIVSGLQRGSTKIITGDAKVNMPVQVCFKVQKQIDSQVVLDEPGAESLAGKGDGLIKSPEYNDIIRFQAFYKP